MRSMKYVEVAILKKPGEFDEPLTYSVPDELASKYLVGQGVYVPLRGKKTRGLIVSLSDFFESDIKDIKPVQEVIPTLRISEKQVKLAGMIARYYRCSLLRALRLMLPKLMWKGGGQSIRRVVYRITDYNAGVKGPKQKSVIKVLKENKKGLSVTEIADMAGGDCSATIRTLVKKGILEKIEIPLYEKFDSALFPLKPLKFELTKDQKEAERRITHSEKPILIHGVTGSGKTEIYLRIILDTIKKGKQAILLVPEIALTPQMIDYFRSYFGLNVALFHSKLSDSQRMMEWLKVSLGQAPLVIGSRSALFAPVTDLGIVIIDEEHEWTYKQESSPYYQAHKVAEMLSAIYGNKLVFGSATPRIETIYKTKKGEYELIHLHNRINQEPLPKVHVVDLREEFKKKNYSIFSDLLRQKIQERLEKKEQIILFVNQRGMARAVVCRDCGFTETCPYCELSLKLHGGSYGTSQTLVCHYCDFKKSPEIVCSACGSMHIKHVGLGTERVEEELFKCYPKARVVRADRDTTSNKEGFEPIYQAFKDRRYDILIGTQMVAKGLDFPEVTLIGIVLADIGLHIPDFRSHERLFQIITQVSGRCGRSGKKGEVVLQTYQPDHFAIKKAADYEYDNFIQNELTFRKKLNYPPFNKLIKFTVVGSDLDKLKKHIQVEKEAIEDIAKTNDIHISLLSAPAMIPKIANRYYYNVLVRSKDASSLFDYWKAPKGWRTDIDPLHIT